MYAPSDDTDRSLRCRQTREPRAARSQHGAARAERQRHAVALCTGLQVEQVAAARAGGTGQLR